MTKLTSIRFTIEFPLALFFFSLLKTFSFHFPFTQFSRLLTLRLRSNYFFASIDRRIEQCLLIKFKFERFGIHFGNRRSFFFVSLVFSISQKGKKKRFNPNVLIIFYCYSTRTTRFFQKTKRVKNHK